MSNWVNKGINLKEWAQKDASAKVIEVYPYASRRALGIGVDIKKKTVNGRRIIQGELICLIGGLDEIPHNENLH